MKRVFERSIYFGRRIAHKFIPRFFGYPVSEDQLQSHRTYDARRNRNSTPPEDEEIDLLCMWAIEYYTPVHRHALQSGLRGLGWDVDSPFEGRRDGVSWVEGRRHPPYGVSWIRLGTIRRDVQQGSVPLDSQVGDLPENVQYATGEIFSLTSSLNCIVMNFVFEREFSSTIERILRKDRETFVTPLRRGVRIHSPNTQKRDDIDRIRAEMSRSAAEWFRKYIPGLFSEGILSGMLPTCEFMTLCQAEPFPSTEEREQYYPYLTELRFSSDFGVWRSASIPGLKFAVTEQWAHAVLVTNVQRIDEAISEGYTRDRNGRLSFLSSVAGRTLAHWGLTLILEGYGHKLNKIREYKNFNSGRLGNPLRAFVELKGLAEDFAFLHDTQAITNELTEYVLQDMPGEQAIDELKLYGIEPRGSEYPFYKNLANTLTRDAKWLNDTLRGLSNYLTSFASMSVTRSNLVFQGLIALLTVILVILTIQLANISIPFSTWWHSILSHVQ